jgi:hypothetical protein
MHPDLDVEPDFPLPGIVSLELAIDRREQTADYLTRRQVPFDETSDGSLVVPANEANGAMLFFGER